MFPDDRDDVPNDAYATCGTVTDLKMGPSWAIICASGHRPGVWPGVR